MNGADLERFRWAARQCADVMLHGALFIQQELPKVHMDQALRARMRQLCDDLNGTKHDVVSELFDLDELMEKQPQDDVIRMRVKRINEWLFEYLPGMNEIVQALGAAVRPGVDDGGAYILVAETAVGILNAYGEVREAAEAIVAGGQKSDETGSVK